MRALRPSLWRAPLQALALQQQQAKNVLTTDSPNRAILRTEEGATLECEPEPFSGGGSGATGSATSFVYQQGGAPGQPGVFVTPADLKAALLTVPSQADKTIVVDTLHAPGGICHLTAADSPWPLDNVTFESAKAIDILQLDAGCTFDINTHTVRARTVALTVDAASAAPIWSPTGAEGAFLFLEVAEVANASATPWIAALVGLQLGIVLTTSVLVGPQAKIDNGATVNTDAFNGSTVPASAFVAGTPGGVLAIGYDLASAANVSDQQTPAPTMTILTTVLQRGTALAPANTVAFAVQPADPAKAPFQTRIASTLFNTTEDTVLYFGYNSDLAVLAEPFCRFNIEQDYEPAPGVHSLECYLETGPAGGATSVRPFAFVLDRLTGEVTTGAAYAGAGGFTILGGPIGGPNTNQVKWTDGQMFVFPTPYGLGSAGALNLNLGGGSVWTVAGFLEMVTPTLAIDATGISFRNLVGVADSTLEHGSGTRFFPDTDGTGFLGIATNRWSFLFAAGVVNEQVTKTAAYVIDSGAIPDTVVWLDTSGTPAFALTLPDPALNKGRRLLVQDKGGNLAVANVTLTRHGGEKINGTAANLALVTNRATWEISSDGTDWITGKSVTGG